MQGFGFRALGLVWAVLLVLLAGGAGVLAWLGPPAATITAEAPAAVTPEAPAPPQPAAQAQAQAETPRPAAPPERRAEAPAAPAAAATPLAAAATPAAPTPAAPPMAPEPPPLAATTQRRAAVDPVIAPPDAALLEASRHGPLPRISADQRSSIRVYARPTEREERRPRVALLINDIGLFAQHSEEAIRRLPGAVALAFSPYALRTEPLVERARARGMEMLIALPLEPQGFGQQADPGDRALLTGLTVADNLDRLDWALSRLQGYVGAVGGLGGMRGERFAANAELLATLQGTLTRRGLLYVDPRPGAPQPARAFGRGVDLLVDEPSATRGEVERRLGELEGIARQQGSALGLANGPAPSVLAAILAWSAGLEDRGIALVPLTAILRRPADQASR